jgi:hypothetical protein
MQRKFFRFYIKHGAAKGIPNGIKKRKCPANAAPSRPPKASTGRNSFSQIDFAPLGLGRGRTAFLSQGVALRY